MTTEWQEAYRTHGDLPEDFWGRRATVARHQIEFAVFGRRVTMSANEAQPLAAAAYSTPLYSRAPLTAHAAFDIQVVVLPARINPGPPPADLPGRIWYSGDAQWLMLHAGAWGHAYVDLGRGNAIVVLAPELAADAALFSRALLNTILLNFCLGSGFGMLHASCLEREGRVLMLMAAHNTGKSTTALRLLDAGFRLITDSMIHIVPGAGPPLLVAFPVGLGKLRADMAAHFPHLRPLLRPEAVRDEVKYVLDLRELDPKLVVSDAVTPAAIELCLLERGNRAETSLNPASPKEVWRAIMANSLFHDTKSVWERNLAQIDRVVSRARCHRLSIGEEPGGILAAVETLWTA